MYVDLSNLTDGFSSKFRVLSYFVAIIKIKKLKKKIYIYEKKNKDCPYLFTDHCLIKKFKIIKLKKKPKTKVKFTPYNYNEELKQLKFIYNITNNSKFDLVSNLSFRDFIPNKNIKNKINKISLPQNLISIHIRSTDREIKIDNFFKKIQFEEMIFDFQIDHMIKNLLKFIKQCSNIKNIFISSDNKYYKEKIQNELESHLNIYLNNSKYKIRSFRQTNGTDFLTELFCMSKSNIIISTLGGAVPTAARLISRKKIKFYKWTNRINFYIFFKYLILIIFNLKKIKAKLLNYLQLKK